MWFKTLGEVKQQMFEYLLWTKQSDVIINKTNGEVG